jgi:hypothetical protein
MFYQTPRLGREGRHQFSESVLCEGPSRHGAMWV